MRRTQLVSAVVLATVLAACGEPEDTATTDEELTADEQAEEVEASDDEAQEDPTEVEEASEADAEMHVVDIVSTGHDFDLPDEIPSGWVTLRYHNDSPETHFALLADLPAGRTAEDSREEVVPPFQEAMDLINEGAPEEGFAMLEELPAWSAESVYMGGPGFVAPGEVAETTVKLEPGNYQVECYIKTDGLFHTTHMLEDVTVSEESVEVGEPQPDFEVTLTNDGLDIDGAVEAGERTFAVHFEEQMLHGHGLGHDVHVARVDEDTDLDELATWMNWAHPDGLEISAPADFVGGAQTMPEGHTAYVTVELEPGDYAFVAEVDEPRDKGMLEVVTVD